MENDFLKKLCRYWKPRIKQATGATPLHELSAKGTGRETTGNPYDNAKPERFMRRLKYEEVYLNDYDTLADALASVEHFIEAVYNRERLDSAIGYRPPAEFEASLSPPILS